MTLNADQRSADLLSLFYLTLPRGWLLFPINHSV